MHNGLLASFFSLASSVEEHAAAAAASFNLIGFGISGLQIVAAVRPGQTISMPVGKKKIRLAHSLPITFRL